MLLAIETSCDDTAAAVLDGRKVLSNCIANQNLIHKAYGGIVPELASRAHQSKIVPVISQALVEANIDKKLASIDSVPIYFLKPLLFFFISNDPIINKNMCIHINYIF